MPRPWGRVCAVLAFVLIASDGGAQRPAGAPPSYKADPSWPKDLPNRWIIGQVGGLAMDASDHIWVLHRPRSLTAFDLGAAQNPPRSICCVAAPAVIEFDRQGNVAGGWGGPNYVPDWPKQEHSIFVDGSRNVWIGGNGPTDHHILKFSSAGKQILEIGHPSEAGRNNQDTSLLFQPADIYVDDQAAEVYIADGYGNNRIVVYDSNTGAFKRGWGAYGVPLDQIGNSTPARHTANQPPARQFGNPVHCVRVSHDGLVYVCDRSEDRIQVFTKAGAFVREFMLRPETLGSGSAFSLTFSNDAGQAFLLVADGESNVISVLRRDTGAEVARIGRSGRNVGQFHMIHQIVMDSHGDIYTGEADTGMRLQKFTLAKTR